MKNSNSTQQLKKAFLKIYPEAFTISEACRRIGIERSTVWRWKDDKEFQEEFEKAKTGAVELLEQEARRRGFEGWLESSFHVVDKELVESPVRRFSDTLLIFLLKGAAPDKYRDRQSVDVKATGEVIFRVIEE